MSVRVTASAMLVATIGLCNISKAGTPDYIGFAANGVCKIGTCPPTGAEPIGTSFNKSFDFDLLLANGDRYGIAGTLQQQASGSCAFSASQPFSAEYLGNDKNPSTASRRDTLTFDIYHEWLCTGKVTAAVAFSGTWGPGIAASSSVRLSAQGLGGNTVKFGPFAPPKPFGGSGTIEAKVSGSFSIHRHLVVRFGAGSKAGSYVGFGGATPPVAAAAAAASFAVQPDIFWADLDITGKSAVRAVVGQPIMLTTTPAPLPGQIQSWAITDAAGNLSVGDGAVDENTIGKGFDESTSCASAPSAVPSPAPPCARSIATFTSSDFAGPATPIFFWIKPGAYRIEYQYALANGTAGRAQTSFSVEVQR
jgi:hypothetical protein